MNLNGIGASLSEWVDAKAIWKPSKPVVLPPVDDEPERDTAGLGAAEGQSFMIEYRDSTGRPSRRRITVWHLSESSRDGVPFLYARCHERQAMRTFRIDRIECCIDYDGVIHDNVPKFLSDTFGMSIGLAAAKEDAAERRWQLILSAIKADATLLAAMSRCDGHVSRSEVEAILRYLAGLIEASGEIILSDADIDRLDRHIARLRPTSDSIRRALEIAGDFAPHRVQKMLVAAATVMDADLVRHPAESRLLNAVSQELLGVDVV
jgi:hypothetical protein